MEENKKNIVLYSNAASIDSKVYDFALNFNVRAGDETINQVTVVMSPQHFKMLAGIMVSSIEEYEDKVGKIYLQVNENKKEE